MFVIKIKKKTNSLGIRFFEVLSDCSYKNYFPSPVCKEGSVKSFPFHYYESRFCYPRNLCPVNIHNEIQLCFHANLFISIFNAVNSNSLKGVYSGFFTTQIRSNIAFHWTDKYIIQGCLGLHCDDIYATVIINWRFAHLSPNKVFWHLSKNTCK